MFTENKKVLPQEIGGGVTRKILSYSQNGSLIYQEEGQEDKVLGTGDTYYVAPNVVHGVEILEDTMLLDIFTPMREDFIQK